MSITTKYKLCLECTYYVSNQCKIGCQGFKQYFTKLDKEGIKDIKDTEPIIAGIVSCGAFVPIKAD